MATHEADRILDNIDNELAGLTPSRRLRALSAVREKIRDMIDEAEEEDDDGPSDTEEDDDDTDFSDAASGSSRF